MRHQPNSNFKPGDVVCTTKTRLIDYSDCSDSDHYRRLYEIPSGSVGVIVSPPNSFALEYRYAVRFSTIPNYPCLVFSNCEIGPGHYIPEDMLALVQTAEEYEALPVDLDDLFD